MATLYIVGTPIGNLEDVTLRALRVLKEADVIVCEDTRVTKRLLERYEITAKQLSTYNERGSGVTAEKIIGWLEEGKSVALVSDAGTPGISDPGAKLVSSIVQKFGSYNLELKTSSEAERINIQTIPGPSALTAALSIAGVPVHDFVFLGFLPHKKGRETLFKEIAISERAMIFYESPHRILTALESLEKFAPTKEVTIARELTKIHEDVKNATPSELLEFFKNNSEKVRGEFVVIVVDSRQVFVKK